MGMAGGGGAAAARARARAGREQAGRAKDDLIEYLQSRVAGFQVRARRPPAPPPLTHTPHSRRSPLAPPPGAPTGCLAL